MRQARCNVIDQLDREWRQLLDSGAADAAVERWSHVQPALSFDGARSLLDRLTDPDIPVDDHDPILLALLRLAGDDPLAGRLILQRFLPCVKQLVVLHGPVDVDEWVGLLVATAYEVICTYPLDRRPDRVAVYIAWKIRRRALAARTAYGQGREQLTGDDLEAFPEHRNGSAAGVARLIADDLLDSAVRDGLMDPPTAELVAVTRIDGLTVASVARAVKQKAATLRQRRWRAERRLQSALSAGW